MSCVKSIDFVNSESRIVITFVSLASAVRFMQHVETNKKDIFDFYERHDRSVFCNGANDDADNSVIFDLLSSFLASA